MNYDVFFANALARLKEERRYRVFADLERQAGRFPRAIMAEIHKPWSPWLAATRAGTSGAEPRAA